MSAYACEVRKKLLDLGGNHKRSVTVENALAHLRRVNPRRWYSQQAPGRVDRFLRLLQEPRPEEIADVNIAHARITPKLIEAKCAENRELADSLKQFIATALVADPEFYGPEIEAAREIVRSLGELVGEPRAQDGAPGA
ncbi:MAG: hypothetical protein ACOZAM_15210 [Pseudomonadota bacterium]